MTSQHEPPKKAHSNDETSLENLAVESPVAPPSQEIVMTTSQVVLVLVAVFMSIFLVALDRTIITTVRATTPQFS